MERRTDTRASQGAGLGLRGEEQRGGAAAGVEHDGEERGGVRVGGVVGGLDGGGLPRPLPPEVDWGLSCRWHRQQGSCVCVTVNALTCGRPTLFPSQQFLLDFLGHSKLPSSSVGKKRTKTNNQKLQFQS